MCVFVCVCVYATWYPVSGPTSVSLIDLTLEPAKRLLSRIIHLVKQLTGPCQFCDLSGTHSCLSSIIILFLVEVFGTQLPVESGSCRDAATSRSWYALLK